MAAGPLTRHEVDDLYGVTLIEALASKVTVLTGPQEDVVPDDMYRRLALDARRNARFVVADLSGGRLEAEASTSSRSATRSSNPTAASARLGRSLPPSMHSLPAAPPTSW
jgi:1-phosphofructokinase